MKKLISALLLMILTITFTGCQKIFNGAMEMGNKNGEEISEVIFDLLGNDRKEYAETIFDAFVARDTDSLEELFCNQVRNNHDLQLSINQAFEFIDGNVVSFADIEISYGSFHFEDDELIRRSVLEDVRTDTGNRYRIRIYNNVKFHDKDYVGLHQLVITHLFVKNGEVFEIGEFIEFFKPIDIPNEYVTIQNLEPRGEVTQNILVALKNRDTDGLYGMFSDDYQDDDLINEINAAFDFIDGNLLTYSNIDHGSYSRGGGNLSGSMTVYDIVSDTGEMYELNFYAAFKHKGEAVQGVEYIQLHRVNPVAEFTENRYGFHHETLESILIGGDLEESQDREDSEWD